MTNYEYEKESVHAAGECPCCGGAKTLEDFAKLVANNDMTGTCESDTHFVNILVELCEKHGLEVEGWDAQDALFEAMYELSIDRCVHCYWIMRDLGVDKNGECICSDCASELEDED